MLSKVRKYFSLLGKACRMPEFGMPWQWSTLLAQYQDSDLLLCQISLTVTGSAADWVSFDGYALHHFSQTKGLFISSFVALNPLFGAVWQKEGEFLLVSRVSAVADVVCIQPKKAEGNRLFFSHRKSLFSLSRGTSDKKVSTVKVV